MLCQMVDFNVHHRIVFMNKFSDFLRKKHRTMLTACASEIDLAHPAQRMRTPHTAVKHTIEIRRILLPDNFMVQPFFLKLCGKRRAFWGT